MGENENARKGGGRREKGAQDRTQEICAELIFIADLLCTCQSPF